MNAPGNSAAALPVPGTRRKPKIGLALGSGSARGWAHIGVIEALHEAGVKPDIVCGTSVGAVVGAVYAAGELTAFESWVRSLTLRNVVAFMDLGLTGGMLKGERVMNHFRRTFLHGTIEELPLPFAAVATALNSGAEVWLRSGSTVDAVRASIALPGLFTPVSYEGTVLVDGGLVNPVPVSLARAMGADIVIAVDLSSDALRRKFRQEAAPPPRPGRIATWRRRLQTAFGNGETADEITPDPILPSMMEVIASSLNVMQVRITRSRMAGEPPDLVIAPRLAHLGLLDFHRGKEAIDEGRRAVELNLNNIEALKLDVA